MTDGTDGTEANDAKAGEDLTRGQFLTKLSIGLGGVMGAMIAVPVAGMALAPAVKREKFPAVKLGDLKDFEATPDKFVKVVLDFSPEAYDAYVQKRVAFVRLNSDEKTDHIAADVKHQGKSQSQYSVISNRCAHLGCPVQEGGGNFVCPCHGGAYNTVGKRSAGPPARSLDRYLWEVRGKELWAVNIYSVSLGGKAEPLHGPGQHAGDIEGLLYPLQPGYK
ncbi:MAG: Rieske 2Fe-2S domain-containing protein [Thermoleophilia bacterium]|nr:Rieske 2Fe-2S domain-containing protein [Thermoleophilia bacterium]